MVVVFAEFEDIVCTIVRQKGTMGRRQPAPQQVVGSAWILFKQLYAISTMVNTTENGAQTDGQLEHNYQVDGVVQGLRWPKRKKKDRQTKESFFCKGLYETTDLENIKNRGDRLARLQSPNGTRCCGRRLPWSAVVWHYTRFTAVDGLSVSMVNPGMSVQPPQQRRVLRDWDCSPDLGVLRVWIYKWQ